MKTETLKVP